MISKRLETILKLIPNGEVLADIGTDHGYIPTYAVKNNIVKKAIAADISKGSLEKAVIEIKMVKVKTTNSIFFKICIFLLSFYYKVYKFIWNHYLFD